MAYLNFALSIVLNGIILSILGVLVERFLIRYGVVRGATIEVIVGCFFIAFVSQLVDSQRAYWIFWFAASILTPISLNRNDLIASVTKGRWWWKSQNENQHQET
jgi:hypothetical protein